MTFAEIMNEVQVRRQGLDDIQYVGGEDSVVSKEYLDKHFVPKRKADREAKLRFEQQRELFVVAYNNARLAHSAARESHIAFMDALKEYADSECTDADYEIVKSASIHRAKCYENWYVALQEYSKYLTEEELDAYLKQLDEPK